MTECFMDHRPAAFVLRSVRVDKEYPICGPHRDLLRRPPYGFHLVPALPDEHPQEENR